MTPSGCHRRRSRAPTRRAAKDRARRRADREPGARVAGSGRRPEPHRSWARGSLRGPSCAFAEFRFQQFRLSIAGIGGIDVWHGLSDGVVVVVGGWGVVSVIVDRVEVYGHLVV